MEKHAFFLLKENASAIGNLNFARFLLLLLKSCHVKEEAEANKMTKEEQIGRLLRPGYTYRLTLRLYCYFCCYLYLYLYLYLYSICIYVCSGISTHLRCYKLIQMLQWKMQKRGLEECL